MPVPVVAKVGIIAASVAVAAAIALYENPEVRRMTEDLRRRIAIALYSLGDNVGPNRREPRFNRPEDAEGFYQCHDVDADDESRRRQREELMYWNARREEQKRREREESQKSPSGSTFDDFLQPDKAGGSGSYVYNTGSNAWNTDSSNLLRRRGNAEGVRGFNAAMAADNLSGEYGIELDEKPWAMEEEHAGLLSRGHDEDMSDIYNATPLVRSPTLAQSQALPQPPPTAESEVLFDFDHHSELHPPSEYATAAEGPQSQPRAQPEPQAESSSTPTPTSRSATLERELADDEYMTAGQDDRGGAADDAAYASIQAWAHNSSNTAGFYSPLPVSPPAPLSEPEIISEGQLTPTDSASVAGSGVDVAHDAVSVSAAGGDDDYDVMSQTDGGMPTPNSWSEVGSVVSESESAVHA